MERKQVTPTTNLTGHPLVRNSWLERFATGRWVIAGDSLFGSDTPPSHARVQIWAGLVDAIKVGGAACN